jgi:uncharacterized protein (DUF1501 family)
MSMQRREFLSSVLAGLGVGLLPRAARAAATSPRLVFVFLRGGTDALSLVSPAGAGFTTLQGYRPKIAMANPLPFTAQLQLHPAMAPLMASSIKNRLNLILHAGSVTDSRSHFDQQYRVETGDAVGNTATGFLARTMSAQAFMAAAVSRSIPASLGGSDPLVLSDPASVQAGYSIGSLKGGMTRAQRLGLYQVAAGESGSAVLDGAARKAVSRGNTLATELAGVTLASLTAANGYVATSPFGQRLALAAELCTSSLNPQIVTVNGEQFWDSHVAQLTNDSVQFLTLHNSIADLATNLAAFKNDLSARGLWNQTVVVVMSEFGRTVRENGNAGTDHGRGGVMVVMGGTVRPFTDPGYTGTRAWTLPSNPDGSAALSVLHDYRIVLAEIMERHLGMTAQKVGQMFLSQLNVGTTRYLNVLL